MPRPDWTLYYEDGRTFSSLDGEPHESPCWGVVACAQRGGDPLVVGLNSDWLMWRADLAEWRECGEGGRDDHLVHFGHLVRCWRRTRWVGTADFRAIWARARAEFGP